MFRKWMEISSDKNIHLIERINYKLFRQRTERERKLNEAACMPSKKGEASELKSALSNPLISIWAKPSRVTSSALPFFSPRMQHEINCFVLFAFCLLLPTSSYPVWFVLSQQPCSVARKVFNCGAPEVGKILALVNLDVSSSLVRQFRILGVPQCTFWAKLTGNVRRRIFFSGFVNLPALTRWSGANNSLQTFPINKMLFDLIKLNANINLLSYSGTFILPVHVR